LLNILGLPPYEAERTIPVTPMIDQPMTIDWPAINELAARQRPDIIELKLILEADQQRLLLTNNQAKPRLDGVALYRWNGLEGEVPAGNRIGTEGGEFTDWAIGVNFSVPLGLRRERALLRQQQLIIRRDRANLDQGLHQMQHLLALSIRNLDQFYAQYERFQAVRRAARVNLDQQLARYNEGIVQFIVVLQAIVDWGNAVRSEAQALSQYNTSTTSNWLAWSYRPARSSNRMASSFSKSVLPRSVRSDAGGRSMSIRRR
jgi:outer membrane protein TolC